MLPTLARCRVATLWLACIFAGRVLAQTPLPKSSPFEPPAGTPGVAAPNEPFEFAAVNAIEKKTSVYIVDKQLKKGKWIGVGATVDGITVKSYDAERDTVVVRIGEVDKTLALRKSSSTATVVVPNVLSNTTANPAWNTPPSSPAPAVAAPAGLTVPVAPANTSAAVPVPTAPAVPQPPPPAPGTIAHQEQEARMLVSDLLEIGMAQRKAYEEAQKKAQQAGATTPPPRAAGKQE